MAGFQVSINGRFWVSTDPDPGTPENEAIEQYLERVSIAYERFLDGLAGEGWRTDRGEVYLTFGEPDMIEEIPTIGAPNPDSIVSRSTASPRCR